MNITVYIGASKGRTPLYEENAIRLGALIGRGGHTLVYGGSVNGLMGILADSVLASGGKVLGVETQLFADRGLAKEGLTQMIVMPDMASRKTEMIKQGQCFIAFPGGTGTLDEITEIMSMIRLGLLDKPCMLLDIDGYYEPMRLMLDRMVEE